MPHEAEPTSSGSRCARSCATRCARSSPRSGSSSASRAVIAMVAIGEGAKRPASSRRSPSMGTNLLIVSSGADDVGRRARRLRARCRRSPGTTSRAIQTEVPSVRLAAPRVRTQPPRSSARSRTGRPSSPAPRPSTSRSATGRRRSGAVLHARGRRRRRQGRRARPDRRRPTSSAPAPTRSARPCASRNVPFQVVGVAASKGQSAERPGLRRRRVHPRDDLPGEDPGRPAEVHRRARSWSSATSDDVDRRAPNEITALLRDRHGIPLGARRRLLDPQPDRDGRRAAGGHARR